MWRKVLGRRPGIYKNYIQINLKELSKHIEEFQVERKHYI